MTISNHFRSNADKNVKCIACGEQVPRSAAREYHHDGDRWQREDKHIEYMCKPCHKDCDHRSRDGLEETLVSIDAGSLTTGQFIERYYEAAGIELQRKSDSSHD